MTKITTAVLAFLFFFSPVILSAQKGMSAESNLQQDPVFIQNAGQWNDGSLFYYANGDMQATFFKDRVRFAIVRTVEHKHPGEVTIVKEVMKQREKEESRIQGQVWDLTYRNSGEFHYTAGKAQRNYIGFINQNTSSKIVYPNLYNSIVLEDLYPGVDAQFEVVNGQMKINYLLEKSSLLSQVKIEITGFENTSTDAAGNLVFTGKFNKVVDSIPMSYVKTSEGDKAVTASYIELEKNVFGFQLKDAGVADLPLVIDPLYLDYSTYFYGANNNGGNYIYDVEVDKNNYSYLTGYTNDKFAGTPGTFDTTLGGTDGFLAKMPILGGVPIYVVYIGGSNFEYCYAMAATENGDIYLTGYTGSGDFPVTSGVLEQTKPSTGYSSFVMAVKSDGSGLNYSTYIRGYSWVVDVNEKGQVYIAPYGDNPYTETFDINPTGQVGGFSEANVIRLNATGSKILDCVTLKGDYYEYVYALQVDHKDQVYVAGWTNSDNLPVTSGLKNFGGVYRGGGYDGFLFKIDSAFTKYLISKYIGTTGYDWLSAITVNDQEEIFIQGIAGMGELPVPTNTYPGGGSTTGWGGGAAFIMKIQKSGIYPMWSTYIINNTYAWRQRISVNAKDEVIFAGTTWSNLLPVTPDAFQKTLKSAPDGYLGKLGTLGQINYLSYFGGSNYEYLFAVQTKRIGCVTQLIMGGYSASKDWPLKNPWKSNPGGTSFWSGAVCKWRDTLRVDPIEIGPDAVICERVYRILDAGNKGASYRWSTGDTTRSIIAKQPGKYWVTATYGCGSLTDTAVYKTVPAAKLYLPSDSLVCDHYNVVLDARNDTIKGVRYLWSTGDTTSKIKVQQSGLYTVEIETPICGIRRDTINLNKQYTPTTGITPKDTLLCTPFTLQLRSGTDTIKAYYIWNTGDTTRNIDVQKAGTYAVDISNLCGKITNAVDILSDTIPTAIYSTDSLICDQLSFTTPPVTLSKFTKLLWNDGITDESRTFSYSGTWTVEIKNQCATRTDTIKLLFQTTPKPFTVADFTWCDKVGTSFKVFDNLNTTIHWSNGDTGHVFNVQDSGTFVASAKNLCGVESDTFHISMKFTPVVTLAKDTLVCDKNSFVIVPDKLEGFDNFYWSTTATTNTISVNQNGTYTLYASSSCGSSSDDIAVAFLNKPTVATDADASFCDAVPAGFNVAANIGGGPSTGQWEDGSSGFTRTVSNAGTYKFTASNQCGIAEDSTIIKIFTSPTIDLGKDSAYCGLPDITLDAGSGFAAYQWNNGSTSQFLKIKEFGIHSVTVTDNNGCKATDAIDISAFCNLVFYVPGSFTPNRDGVNDLFGPVSKDVEKLTFSIYNRWGQLVFQTNDPNGKWNGEVQGVPVSDGVYVWKAQFSSYNDRYEMNGVITILH
jgi:gliding motility-associated-like protein